MIRLNDFIFPAYFCFSITGSKFIESSCHFRTISVLLLTELLLAGLLGLY